MSVGRDAQSEESPLETAVVLSRPSPRARRNSATLVAGFALLILLGTLLLRLPLAGGQRPLSWAEAFSSDFADYLELSPRMCLVEMAAPKRPHGKTLAEADLQRSYGLPVLALRCGEHVTLNPSPNTQITPGDELLVAGRIADAERLSS